MSTFGDVLRRYREQTPGQSSGNRFRRGARHLSQTGLARLAQVDVSYVCRMESGERHPTREIIAALADGMKLQKRERAALFRAAGYLPALRRTA